MIYLVKKQTIDNYNAASIWQKINDYNAARI